MEAGPVAHLHTNFCSSRDLAAGPRPHGTPEARGTPEGQPPVMWWVCSLMHARHREDQPHYHRTVSPMGLFGLLPALLPGASAHPSHHLLPGSSMNDPVLHGRAHLSPSNLLCEQDLSTLALPEPVTALALPQEALCGQPLACWIKPYLKQDPWPTCLLETEFFKLLCELGSLSLAP